MPVNTSALGVESGKTDPKNLSTSEAPSQTMTPTIQVHQRTPLDPAINVLRVTWKQGESERALEVPFCQHELNQNGKEGLIGLFGLVLEELKALP